MQTIEDFKAQHEGVDLYFQFDRIYCSTQTVMYSGSTRNSDIYLFSNLESLGNSFQYLDTEEYVSLEEISAFKIEVWMGGQLVAEYGNNIDEKFI
jgi:hypothetical protein